MRAGRGARRARRRRFVCLGALVAAVAAVGQPSAGAESAAETLAAYERLLRPTFSARAIPVPAGGTGWDYDVASWRLEQGEILPQRTSLGGFTPGFVFSGRGRFSLNVPDPVERRHLARVSGGALGDVFAVTFSDAVLVTSDEAVTNWIKTIDGGPWVSNSVADKRREVELTRHFEDVAARCVAGLVNGGRYLRVAMKTDEHGWLTFEFDAARREEITLQTLRQNWFTERWVSLDRAEDRRADGRPSGDRGAAIDIEHVDLEVDLTGKRRSLRVGLSGVNLLEALVRAEVTFVPLADGVRALPLYLSSSAEVARVSDEGGRELGLIRDHLGSRTADLEKDVYDSSLVVLLDEPLARGTRRTITVEYIKLMANYAAGRSWYPNQEDNSNDLHTATLRFRSGRKQDVRAVGTRTEEAALGKIQTSTWVVERPTKAVSFAYGRDFREETIEGDGIPPVVSFGPKVSRGFGGNMIRNVGADVASSLGFFEWLFDSELDLERIQLTGIAAGHGQAFDGFIHMGELTYASERPGATELFRAHEAAHQWWGLQVGWESYRDQWLSEALAEYSAMMFVEATVKNGEKHFREMLRMYRDMLLGSLKGQVSKYGRPWSMRLDLSQRKRMGPIGLGYRAGTAEIPMAYNVQVYFKGALVIHMLRRLLAPLGPGEELFIEVLRTFVREQRGRNPSTADFIATVNRVAPGDWSWFFDAWLFGTTIPSYLWSHELPRAPDGDGLWTVRLQVEQRDAPLDYRMKVPIDVELADGSHLVHLADIDEPRETFEIRSRLRPVRVVFNPDDSILARVRRQ